MLYYILFNIYIFLVNKMKRREIKTSTFSKKYKIIYIFISIMSRLKNCIHPVINYKLKKEYIYIRLSLLIIYI